MHSSIIIINHDLFYHISILFEYMYYLIQFNYQFTLYLIYSFIPITIHSTSFILWLLFVLISFVD